MRRPLTPLVVAAAVLLTTVSLADLGAPWAQAAAKKKAKPAPVAAKPMPKVEPKMEIVTLPSPEAPLVAIRLLFSIGSIDDPKGKEGLAALTTMMLTEAGTAKRTYSERIDAFYPMAANLNWNVDRELTVLAGVIHRDNLAAYSDLLVEAVTQPRFDASDFERNKEQLLAALTTTLRATNDELLGLEALQAEIFAGHPYEHASTGTVQGLKSITLDDVKKFYAEIFTQRRLHLGIAGGYPQGFEQKLAEKLAVLPEGAAVVRTLPAPAPVDGRRFTLIEKPTGAVGIHLGFPIPLTRADADYYPLMVAVSYLGEHRTAFGRLFQQLREIRGLNYGNYAYAEYYEAPPFTNSPTPNVARKNQYFSIWIRPVVPENAPFALRNALYELERLINQGLTPEEFEGTRGFLVNYTKLWAQSLPDRLGFLMDSKVYGTPYWIDELDARLSKMTVEDVNRAVKKYLRADAYHAVFVTDKAADLKMTLEKDLPVGIRYSSEPPAEVLVVDESIQKIKFRPTSIEIVPVDQMFEK